ncbi:hypothetical protein NQ176_g11076 [Zarea fungicola]|uniref:Uncharacterized protein n=1 Tax=Zarea fungicola TaxID=93591 RepID=A0ACC1MCP0_9HYPO|nr:hypothetical protein NQ176_g11076 [Lecanicillium fungicola]
MAPRKRAVAKQDPATDTVAAPVNGSTNATIPDAAPYGAVARPLQGIRVVISGHVNVSDYTPHGIEYLLGDLGAAQDLRVTNAVTHVIATREDFLKNATKVRNGIDKGLPILRATWVTECDRTQTFVDIEKHTWPNVIEEEKKLKEARDEYIAGQNTTGQTNGADKKRPIAVANTNGTDTNGADTNGADAVEEEDEQPKAKKPKATRAKKATPKPEPVPEPEDEDEEMRDADEEPANQQNGGEKEAKVAEGQIIKQKGAVIPVDAVCQLPGFQVYVDPDSGIIYDASLNQTNASNNNNKFYIVQLLHEPKADKFTTWTRWGRVGEVGANASLGNGTLDSALSNFEKKFKDKSGLKWEDRTKPPKAGKYAFVERSYEPDSDDEGGDVTAKKDDAGTATVKEEEPEPDCTLDESTKNLMEMIFNNSFIQATLAELNYDANKLPLGKLSKISLMTAPSPIRNGT